MAKPSKRKRKNNQSPNSAQGGSTPPQPAHEREPHTAQQNTNSRLWILGLIALVVSAGANGMLVMQHFIGVGAPGCGPGSACAAAAASAWGSVPGIGWPVSFVGLAYFVAALIVWIITRGAIGHMVWIVRLGALVSLAYVGIMLANLQDYMCMYCLVSHIGNFVFLGTVEMMRRSITPSASVENPMRPLMQTAAGFIGVTIVLASWQFAHARSVDRDAEREFAASTEEILRGGGDDSAFTGRYVLGTEDAAVRIVTFIGYQCAECRRTEQQIERLLRERDDVSLAVKHFPLNPDCNPHVSHRVHGNACWSARAVEAAGILGGTEGFERMHHWLLDRQGTFTHNQLVAAIRQFGFNESQFLNVMRSNETLELVKADADEAWSLGIQHTPMVFLNGVELRGVQTSHAIRRAVQQLAAQGPDARAAQAERPPAAMERFVEVWHEHDHYDIDPGDPARAIGPDDAPVTITMWSDYLYGDTAEADALIREVVAAHDDVRYEFRLFPMHRRCNPVADTDLSEWGCEAIRLAAAAAQVYGHEGYWAMHDWLLERGESFTDADVRYVARQLDMDHRDLRDVMDTSAITEIIEREAREAERISSRRVTPLIFINGRWIPRWKHDAGDVIGTIVEEARRTATTVG